MELFGLLPIDKPIGWTSHDVVARTRRIVGTRRVGHAGTLDPEATGVLVLGVGRATKFLDYVQASTKEYIAHIVLGVTSDTADIDGRAAEQDEFNGVPDMSDIESAVEQFTGEIDQIPPKYSAVKQGGEPLYRRMRRGETVHVPVRRVRIDRLEVLRYRYPDLLLSIESGSGVYIRSLAADLGASLACGAYLHHLLRTRVGTFRLEESWTIENLDDRLTPESWPNVACATDQGISSSAAFALHPEQSTAWYHGRSVNGEWLTEGSAGMVRAYASNGEFAGVGTMTGHSDDARVLKPRIVLATN